MPASGPRPAPADAAAVECRRCRAYCEWVVQPQACVERECPNLYAYDASDGRRYIGCVQRVYAAEIDLAGLLAATSGGQRFGGLKCVRPPLPVCSAAVERAYERRVPDVGCVNPEFGERAGTESFRVFARLSG